MPIRIKNRLIEIERECAFEGVTAVLLISKSRTAIMDTKLRDKLMKENNRN